MAITPQEGRGVLDVGLAFIEIGSDLHRGGESRTFRRADRFRSDDHAATSKRCGQSRSIDHGEADNAAVGAVAERVRVGA
ncbi:MULTISPECIES: hypothetical protein [Rhodopseudomonas]|uniref:hypothetical protein n=1 Tax=Rhodopseudomonas TaxID=1073 RepID=UPI0012373754|nr:MULTISPECIES: hypothetical protein [Rhodopseudomonas]